MELTMVKPMQKKSELTEKSQMKPMTLCNLKVLQHRSFLTTVYLPTIKGYGRVVSTSKITVSSEVQGKLIAAISLKKGVHFKKGQPLFALNSR